ncbi:MAG: FtsK/SpoIIIE domain-containing protein, partial [Phycicoccus sp.]
AWPGDPAPPVRLLPRRIDAAELDAAVVRDAVTEGPFALAVGIAERDLRPTVLDLRSEAHLLVLGESESGKTGVLRLLVERIRASCTPQQARMVVVDYRRGLLGEVPESHAYDYVTGPDRAQESAGRLAATLEGRMPPDDVTPQQLRERSWWSGPELFLVVDDYDLVSTGRDSPLDPVVPFIPHARDVGLHVVVARRSAGAARAALDPLVQRMTELGTAGLLLSGDPGDGAVFGGMKLTPQPPGRGLLLRRSGRSGLVQTAWSEPQA